MKPPWERPEFREVSVNGECTAYSGASREAPAAPSAKRPPAFAPAPPRTADGASAAGGRPAE
jgi:hypothetical protein